MSSNTAAEIRGKLSESFKQLDADVENIVFAAHRVAQLVGRSQEARKQLIAEARHKINCLGIGANTNAVDRLREILDELERLP